MLNETVSVVVLSDPSQSCDLQIESLRNQNYKQFEVLVISEVDAVLDRNTWTASFPNVRFVKPIQNNTPASLNSALSACSGDFIAYLVEGDVWPADRLSKQVQVMISNPELGLCYTGREYAESESTMNPDSEGLASFCPIEIHENSSLKIFRTQVADSDLAALAIVERECIETISVMIAKKCIPYTGLFDIILERLAQTEMWIKILRRFDGAKIITNDSCTRKAATFTKSDYIFDLNEICLKYIQYGVLTNNRKLVTYATALMKRNGNANCADRSKPLTFINNCKT